MQYIIDAVQGTIIKGNEESQETVQQQIDKQIAKLGPFFFPQNDIDLAWVSPIVSIDFLPGEKSLIRTIPMLEAVHGTRHATLF